GQVVEAIAQVELQVKLGNIQAGVDSGHGVLAHSCIYELACEGRSVNGSSLGHRDGRFLLPAHWVKRPCQRVSNSPAPLSSRLQAGGQFHLPAQASQDKDRWKSRYKRVSAGQERGVSLPNGRIFI